MKQFYTVAKLTGRTNAKTAGINAALGLALIFAVGMGCRGLNKRTATQNNQSMQISKELRTSGTVTSANTGGSCAKKINGEIVRSPQVGFSYAVDGKSYTSIGCTYNPQTTVGTRINVCYSSSSPASAKPCSD
jgi:hypothetical protein